MHTTDLFGLLRDTPEETFVNFADFNGHKFGAVSVSGEAPFWEMHPDTDEFFYVLDGELEITLLESEGAVRHVAPAGTAFVVPTGIWHKPVAPTGASFMYFTPGETMHSEAEDPR